MDRVWSNLDEPLVLDDVNFLPKKYADEVLYEILKDPDEYGVKIDVIAAATDVKFPTQFVYRRYDPELLERVLRGANFLEGAKKLN